ncbi:uncharacterized protein LOC128883097 isoform X2 [Hylaeus volcanicus]|uniref:uncharacterized protein LOC128883097 isoform X2 n=1 Tax=Hylaeus volcanicus TaxID=313075 RepID=UPI0023B8680B|nr:uncharacterized protein LOC128883097 isoform X2 [Hylaeus volcanicus]
MVDEQFASKGRWIGHCRGMFSATHADGIDSSVQIVGLRDKIDSVLESCKRLRCIDNTELQWYAFNCLCNASLQLLRDFFTLNLNQLSVIPYEVPPDLQIIAAIPDMFSTTPSEEYRSVLKDITTRLKSSEWDSQFKDNIFLKDSRQLRLQIQKFNLDIDNARESFFDLASETFSILSKACSKNESLQPSEMKPVDQRKLQESMHEMLTRLYRNTSLAPAPLR